VKEVSASFLNFVEKKAIDLFSKSFNLFRQNTRLLKIVKIYWVSCHYWRPCNYIGMEFQPAITLNFSHFHVKKPIRVSGGVTTSCAF